MIFRAALLSLLLAVFAFATESTESVLARIDKEASAFRQLTAKLAKTNYTAVLKDTTKESGAIWIRRSGRGVQVRGEITEPDPRSFSLDGATGQLYYPKIETVQIYDLGKNRSLVDQFMLLGFGSSGRDLAKNYSVKVVGEEIVGGVNTTRLELVPKMADVQKQIESVELWIPADAGHPVQQRFNQPGGDYYLITYSDIRVNPGLPDDAFKLKFPEGTKREHPQK